MSKTETTSSRQQTISRFVRALMSINGETQAHLAPVLGLKSHTGVSDKLNGGRSWSVDDVELLAEHYGIAPADFFADTIAIMSTPTRITTRYLQGSLFDLLAA